MATGFPIFSLPEGARDRVLLKIDPIVLLDIYQFADKETKEVISATCKNKIDISVDFDVYGRHDSLYKRFDKNRKYLVTLKGNGYTNFIYLMENKLIENKQELVDRTFGTRKIPCIFKKEEKKEEDRRSFLPVNNDPDESDEEERNERKRNENKKVIITYWDNIFDETMGLADYLSEVFNSPISELTTSRTMGIWSFRRVIQWIISRQTSIKSIIYHNEALSDEDIAMFFGNCNVIERLTINMRVTGAIQNYRYFDLDVLRIGRAAWVTLNYILDMDCIVLSLGGVYLSSQNLNTFVKQWLNGTNYRLQVLSVSDREKIDKDEILDGLAYTERRGHLITRYKKFRTRDSTFVFPIVGGYDIRRSDGTLATIRILFGRLFWFMVWNDYDISGGWHANKFDDDE